MYKPLQSLQLDRERQYEMNDNVTFAYNSQKDYMEANKKSIMHNYTVLMVSVFYCF